ncbi:MAG: TRAP transporter small permease [Chloroflexi bacterium]|nr:TRAP transporter small permease [Chloroflexota bacterium]
MDKLRKVIENGAESIAVLGGGITLILAVATLIYTILRYAFSYVIPGFYDLGEVLLIVMVALPWGFALLRKGHPSVDIVVTRLSGPPRAVASLIGEVLSVAFCGVMAWVIGDRFLRELTTGTFLYTFEGIKKYPFWLVVWIGSIFLLAISLLLTVRAARNLANSAKPHLAKSDSKIQAGNDDIHR